jgi:hypothetical protein
VIEDILTEYQGGRSYNGIATLLNQGGYTTKRGKQWTAVQVRRIVQRNV